MTARAVRAGAAALLFAAAAGCRPGPAAGAAAGESLTFKLVPVTATYEVFTPAEIAQTLRGKIAAIREIGLEDSGEVFSPERGEGGPIMILRLRLAPGADAAAVRRAVDETLEECGFRGDYRAE